MPTIQTIPIDVEIPDPVQGVPGHDGADGLPGTAVQLPDIDQAGATAITVDLQNKPYAKGTIKFTGPCTVTFINAVPLGDYVFYTRHNLKPAPPITWAEPFRNANGSPTARPKLTASPDGVAVKTDRLAVSNEQTSPGAWRLVGQITDPAVG